MRRMILIATATAAVLVSVSANAQGPPRWGQFWGTWAHKVHIGPGAHLPALLTFNIDGTITGADPRTFGGVPNNPNRYGPIHGVWERTGWRSIGTTVFIFIYNASTGVLSGYQRNRCSVEFSQDFNRYTATEFMETTACETPTSCPDPLDPATKWTPLPNMPQSGSGTRVIRLPGGPLNP